jgi:hypothetical protein
MDNSGIVTYFCKINNKNYIISENASINIYTVNGYIFSTIIECVNYIDKIALEEKNKYNLIFYMEI